MKEVVSKSVVRIVASELDKRQAPLEQAILDLHTRIADLPIVKNEAQSQARDVTIQRVETGLTKSAARVDEIARLLSQDMLETANQNSQIKQLRVDLDALTRLVSELTATIGRISG